MTAREATGPATCIDARMLGGHGTGVRRYAIALREALAHLGAAPLLLDDAFARRAWADRSRAEKARRWLRTRIARPVVVRRVGDTLIGRDVFRRAQVHFRRHNTLLEVRAPGIAPGIMHWTYPVPIRLAGWANIYTIHDAIPLTAPGLTAIDPARHRRLLAAIGASAAAILTVSDHARAEIAGCDVVDPALLTNCGIGVRRATETAPLPAGLSPDGFFLAIGSAEPRKNLPRLIAAWQRAGTSRPLVLVGPNDGVEAGPPGLIRLGYRDDAVVAVLRRHARALFFPSLAEGFGLPIVEAMADGTPVVTSAGGATGEIAGAAALLVDPRETDDIANAIARIDADDELVASLVALGAERAAAFTPERFAHRLAAVHRRVVAGMTVAPDRRG